MINKKANLLRNYINSESDIPKNKILLEKGTKILWPSFKLEYFLLYFGVVGKMEFEQRNSNKM